MIVVPVTGKQLALPVPQWRGWLQRPFWNLPTAILVLIGLTVAALLLLPPAYLLLRTMGSSREAIEMLLRPSTLATLGRTLLLAGSVTIASAIIAIPIAWLTICTDLPARRFWTIASALPLVLPSFVVAYLMVSILGPRGLLQQLIGPILGLERIPSIYGFAGAFLVLTLMSYPFTLLSVRAALQRMDPSLGEAARSLGHSPLGVFRQITLPHLRPALVAGGLLTALYVLRDFGAVTMMRYDTFARIIYIQYQSFTSRSLAAALALVLIGLTGILLFLEARTRGPARYSRSSSGAARKPELIQLGKWRWPALLFVGGVVAVALVIPASGLVYWLIRGLSLDQSLSAHWETASNSFGVSLATAGITMLLALPLALLFVRRPGPLSRLLERLTYTGYALPGIVVALALVYFGATYVRPLYQTLIMLLAAYVLLFIPQALGAARGSLLQLPICLEEAGRSLGRKRWDVFRQISLPLLSPGIAAGAALVFLTAMKELPATLLLSPTGFRTLSTAIWSNVSEAFFAQAAAPALLLILLSSIPLALLTLRER
jgi:iron(III) transport system permease protein